MMRKLAVIIPAFNEAKSIKLVVEAVNATKINDYIIRPIVVNDCSTDNTAEIASNLDCELINLPINLGIGGAVQTGYIFATSNNFDLAVQMDGDGQHPATELHKLVLAMEATGSDIVIGSRFIEKKGFQSSLIRRLGIIYLRNLIRILTGKTITDSTSGFRIFNSRVLESATKYYPDEYPEPESIIYFINSGFSVKEVAVEMIERQTGKSSIGGLKSIYYFWKITIAIFFSYIRSK